MYENTPKLEDACAEARKTGTTLKGIYLTLFGSYSEPERKAMTLVRLDRLHALQRSVSLHMSPSTLW